MSKALWQDGLPAELALALLESCEEGMAVLDASRPELPFAWVNAAMGAITGFGADELLGHPLRVLQGSDREQAGLAELQAAVERGDECTVALRQYRPDGALYHAVLRLRLTRDAGARAWWLCACRDVSAQHEMALALGRSEPGAQATAQSAGQVEIREATDRLTGLQAEAGFELALELAWFSCARDRRRLALFLFAPDYFESYLETFGRVAGDSCLRMVARGVGAAFRRADDVTARLGDAEFAALGISMPEETLAAHARRVIDRIRALAIRNPRAPLGRDLTLSAVVLCASPGQPLDWRKMLAEGRAELAAAQAQGIEQLVVRDYGGPVA